MRGTRPLALLGLVAGLASPAAAQEGEQARRAYVSPYVEVAQGFAADLKGDDDVVTYTQLAAGIDAGIQGRRAEGQLSYRYEKRIGWGDDLGDQDLHSGLARGSLLLAPGLSVEGGGIATRARSDVRGRAPGLFGFDSDNVTEVYSLYAGPTLSRPLGAGEIDAAYRFGYTKAESPDRVSLAPGLGRRDYFDDATNHLATLRVGVEPFRIAPVGLSASAAYEREDAGALKSRYEGWFTRGDVLWPVSPTVALGAGVGYEEIETSSRVPLVNATGQIVTDRDGRFVADPNQPRRVDYRTDGVYYDVGVTWRPNRRTELAARVGERYGSFSGTGSLRYQMSRDIGAQVVVYDGIQTFGRQLRTGLANLPTSFVSTRDQFLQQYNGCVFGTSGQAPGGCLNSVFQSLATTSYRARGIDAVLSATRGLNQYGVGAGYARRDLHTGNLPPGVAVFGSEDESVYAQAFYARQLSRVSSVDAQVFLNWFDSNSPLDEGVLSVGATASYYHSFGRLGTSASAGLYSFKVGDFDSTLSAQALIAAQYRF